MWAFFIAFALAADVPDWAKSKTMERNGNQLRVVCIGNGPSLDLARNQAHDSCQAEAIRSVQTSVEVRSESVETEHDAVFHQEVRSNEYYTGLACKPEKESISVDGEQTTVYLKCVYYLDKIKISKSEEKEAPISLIRHMDTITEDVPEVSTTQEQGYKQGAARHILLSSVPGMCNTVIINGSRPARVVRCTENPQLVTVDSLSDKELIVRPKNKGLMPKRVLLKEIPGNLEIQYENQ